MAAIQADSDDCQKRPHPVSAAFDVAAQWTSRQCGHASTFILACAAIVLWAITGPMFGYSDTWQLVINTGTTIVTFLMVFLIQNTQNRDITVLHVKLDELIRVSEGARNRLLNLEDMTEEELEHLKGSFARLAGSASDHALLREAVSELTTAAGEIQDARQPSDADASERP
jgi:low affinity Fe/Cu permease